jgi:hypothetical protein
VPPWVCGLLAALLPLVVLGGGITVLNLMPAHKEIAAIVPPLRALNVGPYDAEQAKERWKTIKAGKALTAERTMLRIDLLFPLFYGSALAAGLWFTARGLHFAGLATLLAPVLLMMVADWTENTIQLAQLSRYDASGDVSAPWMTVASVATCLKLALVGGLSLLNLGAGIRLVCCPPQG